MNEISVVDNESLIEILTSDKGQEIAAELLDDIGLFIVERCKTRGDGDIESACSAVFWATVFLPCIIGKILGAHTGVHVAGTACQASLMASRQMQVMLTDLRDGIEGGKFDAQGLWKKVLN